MYSGATGVVGYSIVGLQFVTSGEDRELCDFGWCCFGCRFGLGSWFGGSRVWLVSQLCLELPVGSRLWFEFLCPRGGRYRDEEIEGCGGGRRGIRRTGGWAWGRERRTSENWSYGLKHWRWCLVGGRGERRGKNDVGFGGGFHAVTEEKECGERKGKIGLIRGLIMG